MKNFKFKPWMAVVGGIVAVFAIIVVSLFATFNGIQKTGVDLETQLNSQYLNNQNEYSAFRTGFYEQLGIAQAKADKLDQILHDAVTGRYDGKMSSAQVGQGSLFSAIHEAYPDLTGLNVYDKIVDYIQAGRTAYKGQQSKLLDMLRNYDKWRKSGIIHKMLVNMAGFPSNDLVARVGTDTWRGQAAEDKMYQIVVSSDTLNAYQTGVDTPLTVPGQPATTK